jgi:hypothetical protein
MATDEDRCRDARTFQRIDAAFRAGDLDGLRAAVDDPADVPNGRMPYTIGSDRASPSSSTYQAAAIRCGGSAGTESVLVSG